MIRKHSRFLLLLVLSATLLHHFGVELGLLLLLRVHVHAGDGAPAEELHLVAVLVQLVVVAGGILGCVPVEDELAFVQSATALTLLPLPA
jgi:hypothetical protein